MKIHIIEIGLPTEDIPLFQPVLVQSLQEVGGLLIGRQIYKDQTLLVLRLSDDQSLQYHNHRLATALQQKQISAFQVITCHLFKIVFKQDNYRDILETFPLQIGETWFEAIDEPLAAYLCLSEPHLSREQISWLTSEISVLQWTNES